MKSFLKITLLVTAISLLFTQCKKEEITTFNSYFCSANNIADGQPLLYINGEYKGELPSINEEPPFGDDSPLQKMLCFPLPSGKYKVEVKDKQGNIKMAGTIKFKNGSLNTYGDCGNFYTSLANGRLIVVFY